MRPLLSRIEVKGWWGHSQTTEVCVGGGGQRSDGETGSCTSNQNPKGTATQHKTVSNWKS